MADLTLDSVLPIFDLAVFAVVGIGLFLTEINRPPRVADSKEAFQLLERSIRSNIIDMPEGYSWGEAVKQMRKSGISADWQSIEKSLADYQATRFGGRKATEENWNEVARLALRLRRRKIGNRTQIEGPGTG